MKLKETSDRLIKLIIKPLSSPLICIGVPTLVSMLYLGFIASDVYTSSSQFIIKRSNAQISPMTLGIPFLNPQASTTQEDALILHDYALSMNLIRELQKEHSFLLGFEADSVDWWSRLSSDAPPEKIREYLEKYIVYYIDPESGIVTLDTSAFSPEVAQNLNKTIIGFFEAYINNISVDLANAQVGFVREELVKAEAMVTKARTETLAFQSKYNLIDPVSESASLFERISTLEGRLSQKETELKTLLSFLQEESPKVAKVRKEISALNEQITEETTSLAGGEERSLNQIMAEYQQLKISQEFALNSYTSALASLESARTEASRQIKFLVMISDTGLPVTPSYPKFIRGSLTVFVLSSLIFLVLRLVIATINDHRD